MSRAGGDFVLPAMFDRLCSFFGPRAEGGDRRVSKILGRCTKTVGNWRSGVSMPPRWAFELLRLTLDERQRVYREMTGEYQAYKAGFGFGAGLLMSAIGKSYGAAVNDALAVFDLVARDEG